MMSHHAHINACDGNLDLRITTLAGCIVSQSGVVCCRVLCCSVLQRVAACTIIMCEFEPQDYDTGGLHEMPLLTNTGTGMSVLQHVAACCRVLPRVAACCSAYGHEAWCSVLQRVAACCSVLKRVYMHEIPLLTNTGTGMNVLQHVAACCRVLPRVAACCSAYGHGPWCTVLQRVAACVYA